MFEENPFDAPTAGTEDAARAHLSDYWTVLVRRRWLVAGCVAVGLLAAAFVSVTTPPSFRATSVLDIGNDRTANMDLGLASSPSVPAEPDPDFQATQVRLINSVEVARRVVAKLDLAARPEFNRGPRRLFVRKPAPPRTAADAERRLTWLAGRVRQGLQVSPVRGTDLVEVGYVSTSPRLAADVANAAADAYIEWKVDSMYGAMNQISTFLGTQIAQLKREIDGEEQRLLAFGKEKDIVSADPQSNSGLQNFEALNREYEAAVADRVAREARYRELQNASASTAAADPAQGALALQLQNEQARLEREYAEKLNLFKPEWPAMLQLKAQIDKGREHLQAVVGETASKARDAARNEYLTAQRREASLSEALKSQKTATMEGNNNAVQYNSLRGEIDARRALLDTLVRREAETEVLARQKGARESSVRVVDRAQPPESRFRPSYRLNGLLGLLAGAGAGILLVFFLEYMDRTFRTPEEVRRYLGLPTLGTIPAVGRGRRGYGASIRRIVRPENDEAPAAVELLPARDPHSAVAEAYRRVRTALLLSQAGGVKSVVVTSGFAREGKSCTAANLAVVMSQLDWRVLLIDADLHQPCLHEMFRTSNRQGLVTVLAENLERGRAIVRTSVPNVFLLPAGPASPNPSGLLSSGAMTRLLDDVKGEFDFVVIDTPPLFPLADALILGHQTDGVVLCVRAGETQRPRAARACETLRQNRSRILGVVLNALPENLGGYDEGYGLYYHRPAEGADTPSSASPLAARR
jgi:capsular exopolysaccharide synthesis family protein